MAVDRTQAPAKGGERAAVGRSVGAETPGPQHQFAVTVHVEEHARGRGRRRCQQVGRALIRKQRLQVGHDRGGLWLRGSGCAAKGRVAGLAAGAIVRAPLERKVAIEVGATLVAGRAAVVLVDVLAPRQSDLGLLAAIRVGLRQQVQFEMVEHEAHIGVVGMPRQKLLGEAHQRLGGAVLARMDGADDEGLRLRSGDRRVGQPQHPEVISERRIAHLLPGIADVDAAGERRVVGNHLVDAGEGLLDRAVAGEGRYRAERTRRIAHQRGQCRVDADAHAVGEQQRVLMAVCHLDDRIALVVAHFPRFGAARHCCQLRLAVEIGAHHPRAEVGWQRGRRCNIGGVADAGAQRQRKCAKGATHADSGEGRSLQRMSGAQQSASAGRQPFIFGTEERIRNDELSNLFRGFFAGGGAIGPRSGRIAPCP